MWLWASQRNDFSYFKSIIRGRLGLPSCSFFSVFGFFTLCPPLETISYPMIGRYCLDFAKFSPCDFVTVGAGRGCTRVGVSRGRSGGVSSGNIQKLPVCARQAPTRRRGSCLELAGHVVVSEFARMDENGSDNEKAFGVLHLSSVSSDFKRRAPKGGSVVVHERGIVPRRLSKIFRGVQEPIGGSVSADKSRRLNQMPILSGLYSLFSVYTLFSFLFLRIFSLFIIFLFRFCF